MPAGQPKILSLSELAAGIARTVSDRFPYSLWIKAELAKLNHYPESGHCYPALVEKEKGAVKAEMRGTIWANDFLRINQRFLQVTREPLKEGIHVLFRAMVKFHPVYGLSLQISDIDPSFTLGEMAREKMETIARLKKEGIFDLNRSRTMPLLPRRIAIISVQTSKGYSDFISILENNAWGYAFHSVLFPALLQGDKAVDSILGQLRAIKSMQERFDAVAIIRGGGGDVGLSCYDHYELAREVATFPLPVLTGIGHSTNETVVEMVAGQNKITPTDVAYFLIQHFHNFAARVDEAGERIAESAKMLLLDESKRLNDLSRRVASTARQFLLDSVGRLSQSRVLLRIHSGQLISGETAKIRHLESQARALDPALVLQRGYSITYADGKALREATEIKPGVVITTRLFSGNIKSEVKSTET